MKKNKKLYITEDGVRFRKAPDASGSTNIIDNLSKGQEVVFVDGPWVKIKIGDKEGWTHGDYIIGRGLRYVVPTPKQVLKFIIGKANLATSPLTAEIRKIIKDEFGGDKNKWELQCTEYVQFRVLQKLGHRINWGKIKSGRNGGKWWSILKKQGYSIFNKPQDNCAMSFIAGISKAAKINAIGHVAFVEKINSDESIEISEANWPRNGKYNCRRLTKQKWQNQYRGRFIYFKNKFMKIDAHYYAVLAFARACGFKKESAYKVAYASQFVDDAKIDRISFKNKVEGIEEIKEIKYDLDQKSYFFPGISSCHDYFRLGVGAYNYTSMVNNTTAFHFIPACRGDTFVQKLRCFAHSKTILETEADLEIAPIAKNILNKTLEDDDIIKLGVVLHAYADIFSHQGFSGLLSEVNDIENLTTINGGEKLEKEDGFKDKLVFYLKGIAEKRHTKWEKTLIYIIKLFKQCKKLEWIFDLILPAYGHGQVATCPDIPYLIWSYSYDRWSYTYEDTGKQYDLPVRIDNKERFKEAFTKIEEHLKKFINKFPQYREEGVALDNLDILRRVFIFEGTLEERIENWRKIMIEKGLFNEGDPELTYDKNQWVKDVFKDWDGKKYNQRNVEDTKPKSNFVGSDWCKYSLVVRWYKEKLF